MNALLAIAYRSSRSLKLALLTALEQIGDARALPALEHLLADGAPEIRARASECLPLVQQRIRQKQESMTLLRASDAYSAMPAEQLLRPASAQHPTPPEQLLRPLETPKE